ncbi:MAG: DNA methyltransferase, partial [Blastocatellia bacterium]
MILKEKLFGQLDFRSLNENHDFKEDSVREVVILPLLKELGYQQSDIVRSKALQHPFLKIGSKKRRLTLVPDYVLKVENNFAWVLDAKAPNQKVTDSDHIQQVYSYASHPEIRSTYFALCNGLDFSLYRREATDDPILLFPIPEIEHHWEKFKMFLAPGSFQVGKSFTYEPATVRTKSQFDYSTRPLLEEILAKKRAARRHFGVHGYFTKQTWNVVAEYILNFTKPGDLVLDPYGGSGVTAIEAMMNNRRSISIDLN